MKKTKKRNPRAATAIDTYIAARLRADRIALGLSQAALGDKLGVSFQQIQKYEKGVNRVGSGRLHQIAEIFKVSIGSFYSGAVKQKDINAPSPFDLLADALTMQMVREFGKMTDKKTRRAILAVVEAMVA